MNDKEKWIAEVMDSMHGSQKATPKAGLWDSIKEEIGHTEHKLIPIFRLQLAAAAAVLLLGMNITMLFDFSKKQSTANSEFAINNADIELISSYNLYE